jgi:O-antigen ligase
MIRITALALYVTFFSAYAWKDWYKALCALILLMAVIEHPDMPKTIFGIQGLNPWNLLLLNVVGAWLTARRQERLTWDLPGHITFLLSLYLGVILVGFVRMILDRSYLNDSILSLISENLVNTIKWVIPGLLLFDGCRTRERFRMAVTCVLGVYALLAIQVIRWMPLSNAVNGEALSARSLKILMNEVGYHRVNMSAMLAGASWAIFATLPLVKTSRQRTLVVLSGVAVLLAQALTGGRAGYVTCALVGFVLCVLRWRKVLLLAPVGALAIVIVAPGVAQRMFEGFSPETRSVPTKIEALRGGADASGPDAYTITAGRIIIWPYVIEKILQRPFVGYGRLAMVRTGLSYFLATQLDEGFAHPHNAYLEMLLDNGLIGFVLVMPFYGVVVWKSYDLFRDSRSAVFIATGGVTLALLLALLIAAMGSQTFYPREGWVSMWCMIFLMLRVRHQRAILDLAASLPAVSQPTVSEPAITVAAAPARLPARPSFTPQRAARTAAFRPPRAAGSPRTLTKRMNRSRPVTTLTVSEDQVWEARLPPRRTVGRVRAERRPPQAATRGFSRAR